MVREVRTDVREKFSSPDNGTSVYIIIFVSIVFISMLCDKHQILLTLLCTKYCYLYVRRENMQISEFKSHFSHIIHTCTACKSLLF